MFEKMVKFLRGIIKKEEQENPSKDTAKERLHLVLMQDRANVSADFLELMKQEIIEVIKKYIDIDESSIDVRLTNKSNDDGSNGAPALYANIPIVNVRNDMKKEVMNNKERPAYLKKEEKIEPASSNEEQVKQTEKTEENDKEEPAVEFKEEILSDTNDEVEAIENEQMQEETVEIEEQVENTEDDQEDVEDDQEEFIEEVMESEDKQLDNKNNYGQQQYNQKNYNGGKKKNRKHKRNNRNYPKRG